MVTVWRVQPTQTPAIFRHCSRCTTRRRFRSSGAFRVNAHGVRLDIWLIYRCEYCDERFNRSIKRQIQACRLGDDLTRYERNDPELAWQHAFDLAALRRAGIGVDADVPFEVARAERTALVSLEPEVPLPVRAERVVSRALGVSRSKLRAAVASGHLCAVDASLKRRLGRALTSSLTLNVRWDALEVEDGV